MPSRTYIEMALDLNSRGRYPLPNRTIINFIKVESGLRERPELIEEIVRNRVKTIKFIHATGVYPYLHRYHYTMIDYAMACKLLGMGCYMTMPFRSGKDWFSKAITNMWYGVMTQDEIGDIYHNEFVQKKFNIPETKEKTYAEQIWEKQNCGLGKNMEGCYDEFTS